MQVPAEIDNVRLKTITGCGTKVAHSMLQDQTTLRTRPKEIESEQV